jgi:protease-4
MADRTTGEWLVRIVLGALTALVVSLAGYFAFVRIPESLAELLGILLTLGLVVAALGFVSRVLDSQFPDYNTAEVAVEGPISRDGGGRSFPPSPTGPTADDIVDQIDRADEDPNAEALVVKLNTPGGEVLPSDDIRRAVMEFDGPTVAYATDTCASGGYWIASGCDELWARDASVVGSIGVLASRVNVNEFVEERGISYERFVGGKYKDAGTALKEMTDEDRAYLQGITDDIYENFIERVTEGRDIDPDLVRDTEARIYLGEEAHEMGLVDELGTREDVREAVSERLGVECAIQTFEPERGIRGRIGLSARRVAYAFGAGIAAQLAPAEGVSFELK